MREVSEIDTGATDSWAAAYDDLLQIYLSDTNYTWENTLAIGVAPPNPYNLGGTDLFTALLFDIADQYGLNYVETLWQIVDSRPVATTTQDAVDNLVIALSIATNHNLVSRFVMTGGGLSLKQQKPKSKTILPHQHHP